MIKSAVCELLGIEYPVFQGGMAWVADAHLAAAVSEAGGLGIIAGMNMNGEQLRAEIRKLKTMTKKPFGVNVMLMSPYAAEVSDVVIEEGVPVLTTGAGNPLVFMKKWTEAGIKVIPVVASVALAQMVEKRGACAVVAEGGESGGHIGEANTMPLVPQIVDAVRDRGGRNRRRARCCGGVYARRRGRADRYALFSCRRMHDTRNV